MGAKHEAIGSMTTRCFRCGERGRCAIVPQFQTNVIRTSLCASCLREALQAVEQPVVALPEVRR